MYAGLFKNEAGYWFNKIAQAHIANLEFQAVTSQYKALLNILQVVGIFGYIISARDR